MNHIHSLVDILVFRNENRDTLDAIRNSNESSVVFMELDKLHTSISDKMHGDIRKIVAYINAIGLIIENEMSVQHYISYKDWISNKYEDFNQTLFEYQLEIEEAKREEAIKKWVKNLVQTQSDIVYHLTTKIEEIKEGLKQDIGEPEYLKGSKYWNRLIEIKELDIYSKILSDYHTTDEEKLLEGIELDSIAERVLLLFELGFFDAITNKVRNKYNSPSNNFLAEITSKVLNEQQRSVQPIVNALLSDNKDSRNYPKKRAKIDVILQKLNPD